MNGKRLTNRQTKGISMIEVEGREYDWKCVECGYEMTSSAQPHRCPECNCSSADLPEHFVLFIRAETMEFEPGLVTWWRQKQSEKEDLDE